MTLIRARMGGQAMCPGLQHSAGIFDQIRLAGITLVAQQGNLVQIHRQSCHALQPGLKPSLNSL